MKFVNSRTQYVDAIVIIHFKKPLLSSLHNSKRYTEEKPFIIFRMLVDLT